MAQLPYLMYDQKPPMSSEEFKELALPLLSRRDRSHFKYLIKKLETVSETSGISDVTSSSGCAFIDNWLEWERVMRINLARHRSIKLYHDENFTRYSDDSVPADTGITETIIFPVVPADAYAAAALVFSQDGSPLDGEVLLDKTRWNAIDSLTGNDYFHENNVYAYYLKLLLLERRQLFDVEKGFTEYRSLYVEILERSRHGHNSQGENK